MMNGIDDEVESIGVEKTTLSEFFLTFSDQLKFVSGIFPIPDGLTLADLRRPNLVLASPGVGKTMGIQAVIKEVNKLLPEDKKFNFKKILLGQTIVGELSGIPLASHRESGGKKEAVVLRAQADNLPVAERDGEYGVLLLDEITTANDAQIQPALGLCDDTRDIGTYKLPEHWVVVAAGNGPDCANFNQLPDMTLSRFMAYDISYNYTKDWRPYAQASGIDPMIIAFLNFSPEYCSHVVSEEQDKAGKQFPCPRTWERLSTELKKREAVGRPVPLKDLASFASRCIGAEAARKFTTFATFKDSIKVDVKDILSGKVTKADKNTKEEEYHIMMQRITREIQNIMKETLQPDGGYTWDTYHAVANGFKWMLSMADRFTDKVIRAIIGIITDIPNLGDIVNDSENFDPLCPEYTEFIENNESFIEMMDISIAGSM